MKRADITLALERLGFGPWARVGNEKGNPETRSADYQADDQRGRGIVGGRGRD